MSTWEAVLTKAAERDQVKQEVRRAEILTLTKDVSIIWPRDLRLYYKGNFYLDYPGSNPAMVKTFIVENLTF